MTFNCKNNLNGLYHMIFLDKNNVCKLSQKDDTSLNSLINNHICQGTEKTYCAIGNFVEDGNIGDIELHIVNDVMNLGWDNHYDRLAIISLCANTQEFNQIVQTAQSININLVCLDTEKTCCVAVLNNYNTGKEITECSNDRRIRDGQTDPQYTTCSKHEQQWREGNI